MDKKNHDDQPNDMRKKLPYVKIRIPPPIRSPSQAPTFTPPFQHMRLIIFQNHPLHFHLLIIQQSLEINKN